MFCKREKYKVLCPPYVWIPPVHTQHKESMLCQTKGVSICSIHLDTPICLNAPCMLGCPHMFGCPICLPLCLDTPIYLDAPVCLDASCMLGHPLCLDVLICLDDFWMPHVHTQHKESMLCQNKGVSICPYTFGCPHMLGCTPCMIECPHVFGCHICLDTPCLFRCPICLDTP